MEKAAFLASPSSAIIHCFFFFFFQHLEKRNWLQDLELQHFQCFLTSLILIDTYIIDDCFRYRYQINRLLSVLLFSLSELISAILRPSILFTISTLHSDFAYRNLKHYSMHDWFFGGKKTEKTFTGKNSQFVCLHKFFLLEK